MKIISLDKWIIIQMDKCVLSGYGKRIKYRIKIQRYYPIETIGKVMYS